MKDASSWVSELSSSAHEVAVVLVKLNFSVGESRGGGSEVRESIMVFRRVLRRSNVSSICWERVHIGEKSERMEFVGQNVCIWSKGNLEVKPSEMLKMIGVVWEKRIVVDGAGVINTPGESFSFGVIYTPATACRTKVATSGEKVPVAGRIVVGATN